MHSEHDILCDILNTAPFPGWDIDSLYPLTADKLSRLEFDLMFPYGTISLISGYQRYLNKLLSDVIATKMSTDMGVTAKIRWMVQAHFAHILQYADAEQAAISKVYNPSIALYAPSYIGDLMDLIWRAAGDQSTDMNYYTKRISLGIMYVTTLLYWYQSNASIEDVMGFFDDRLDNLNTLTKAAQQHIPNPQNLIKNFQILKAVFLDK